MPHYESYQSFQTKKSIDKKNRAKEVSANKTVDEGWYRLTITKNGCSRSAEIKICVHQAIEFNLE